MCIFDPSPPSHRGRLFRAYRKIAFGCIELEPVSVPDAALGSNIPFATVTIGPAPDIDVALTAGSVSRRPAEIRVRIAPKGRNAPTVSALVAALG